jgi:hypothetical protein
MSAERAVHLTAQERETVITLNDSDDLASIWTAQRAMITKLKANEAAVLVEEGLHGSSRWASFTLPKELLSLRSKRRAMSEEQRVEAAERMRRLRASQSTGDAA